MLGGGGGGRRQCITLDIGMYVRHVVSSVVPIHGIWGGAVLLSRVVHHEFCS